MSAAAATWEIWSEHSSNWTQWSLEMTAECTGIDTYSLLCWFSQLGIGYLGKFSVYYKHACMREYLLLRWTKNYCKNIDRAVISYSEIEEKKTKDYNIKGRKWTFCINSYFLFKIHWMEINCKGNWPWQSAIIHRKYKTITWKLLDAIINSQSLRVLSRFSSLQFRFHF